MCIRKFLYSVLIGMSMILPAFSGDIVHDAEYTIIEAQNGKAWAADDKTIDKKLADIRKKNGGKPPNIIYILLDDVGFGEIGMDELSVIRGYKTPNMTNLAKESLSLQRMYTEPSCTPTRVAMSWRRGDHCRGTQGCRLLHLPCRQVAYGRY